MTPEEIKKNGTKAFADVQAMLADLKRRRAEWAVNSDFAALFDVLLKFAEHLEGVAETLADQGLKISRQHYPGDH